jgi:hypothetical protein
MLPAAVHATPPQPIADLGFVGTWRPAITGGVRWTYTPVSKPTRDPDTGMVRPIEPGWSLQATMTGGVTFARVEGDDVSLTALVGAGGLRPISGGPISGFGPILLTSSHPEGIGPALRVEAAFHALGLQMGPMWLRHHRGPSLVVTADVLFATIRDVFKKGTPG